MAVKVLLKKGSSRHMKKNITSPRQAKRILVAIKALQSTPITKLEWTGAVKKLNVSGRDDVYAYRVSPKERIVFSPMGEDCVIHDILCVGKDNEVKSFIADIKER